MDYKVNHGACASSHPYERQVNNNRVVKTSQCTNAQARTSVVLVSQNYPVYQSNITYVYLTGYVPLADSGERQWGPMAPNVLRNFLFKQILGQTGRLPRLTAKKPGSSPNPTLVFSMGLTTLLLLSLGAMSSVKTQVRRSRPKYSSGT